MLLASHQFLLRIAQVLKVSGDSTRSVNYYFYYDYLHTSSEERVGLGCYRVGREQRRSYTNKYKWYLPYS